MLVDIEVYKGDDDNFVASCAELDLYSRAESRDEAVEDLKYNILDYIENSKIYTDAMEEIDFSVSFYSSRYPRVH